jgi:outer membrane protein assembly factor BamD
MAFMSLFSLLSMKGMKQRLIYVIIGILALSSCSEYQMILKNPDRQAKYEYAMKMYEKKKYGKSVAVFEELYTTSRGDINAENIHYYFAKSYYGAGDYLLSSYFFEDFLYKFPNSKYVEDAAYNNAMCYYKDSPENPLDQTSTYKAIEQLQLFVDRYPHSTLVAQCNKRIEELREKLESKAYRVAYQYYRMEYYQAACVAFTLLLKDFPDSDRRSKVSYYIIKSSYVLAINSVKTKKEERLQGVSKYFDKFASGIKDENDLKDATDLNEKAKVLYQEAKAIREAAEKEKTRKALTVGDKIQYRKRTGAVTKVIDEQLVMILLDGDTKEIKVNHLKLVKIK